MAQRRLGRPRSASGDKKVRTYIELAPDVDAQLQQMADADDRSKASMAKKIFMAGLQSMKQEKS
jgi:predicted transcriptional regulator